MERAPFRGEHTNEVLMNVCGYAAERVSELAAAGVFGKTRGCAPPSGTAGNSADSD
jgi:hypothetical protein